MQKFAKENGGKQAYYADYKSAYRAAKIVRRGAANSYSAMLPIVDSYLNANSDFCNIKSPQIKEAIRIIAAKETALIAKDTTLKMGWIKRTKNVFTFEVALTGATAVGSVALWWLGSYAAFPATLFAGCMAFFAHDSHNNFTRAKKIEFSSVAEDMRQMANTVVDRATGIMKKIKPGGIIGKSEIEQLYFNTKFLD